MTMSLRAFGALAACVLVSSCGSSSGSSSGQPSAGNGRETAPEGQDDEAMEGAMALANSLRAEYTRLGSEHEAAWQERIRVATGPDLDTIGVRFARISADFSARSDQAWQEMNTAVAYLRSDQPDAFRQHINASRAHVAALRQMVEEIRGELAEMQREDAPPPTTPEGGAQPAAAE